MPWYCLLHDFKVRPSKVPGGLISSAVEYNILNASFLNMVPSSQVIHAMLLRSRDTGALPKLYSAPVSALPLCPLSPYFPECTAIQWWYWMPEVKALMDRAVVSDLPTQKFFTSQDGPWEAQAPSTVWPGDCFCPSLCSAALLTVPFAVFHL